VALSSCGGSDGTGAAPEQGSGPGLDPQALQRFTCADWQRADAPTRLDVIDRLRAIIGGQVTGEGVAGRGSVLEDERAYRLFDTYCEQPFASDFVLYKLYGQAAGFAGVAP
jgi:hypothetical protein